MMQRRIQIKIWDGREEPIYNFIYGNTIDAELTWDANQQKWQAHAEGKDAAHADTHAAMILLAYECLGVEGWKGNENDL